MDEALTTVVRRIAEALDRLAPPAPSAPPFDTASIVRHDASTGGYIASGCPALPLDLLRGIEAQKARVVAALDRFGRGLPANHMLLWGVRGTGKSSLVKAAFADASRRCGELRLLEIDRDDLAHLPALFEVLRRHPWRVVIFCDDLSFDDGSSLAKTLKSALEGGVAGPPDNVLFAATSNRRHLLARDHGEGRGAIATAEDAEEDVSVSDRFGLWIGFPPMDQESYLAAVRAYADRFGLASADLERRALAWSMLRGARSGRVAWQFIRDLAGEQGVPLPG
ncbi:MAG: ATP-binding protein [Caulobacteraceae bacterium]|nr:ATP-binding protein [Caulobacteraceae bacterium]